MKLKQLLTENRAVSPVIGVILMVAITVILAAVIGTFVLGLGEGVQSTPQAKFAFDYQNSNVTITHEGGDAISAEELSISSSADFTYKNMSTGNWSTTGVESQTYEAMGASSDVTAGTSVTIAPDGGSFDAATVRTVWSDLNTDKSATLGKWSGPEA